jgi:hypothetical protein
MHVDASCLPVLVHLGALEMPRSRSHFKREMDDNGLLDTPTKLLQATINGQVVRRAVKPYIVGDGAFALSEHML